MLLVAEVLPLAAVNTWGTIRVRRQTGGVDMNAIGKYKLLEEMGTGAAGKTYRASDTFRNREVVLKVLSPTFSATPERHDQVSRDLGATADLCHPHIIRIRDLGEVDGSIYIATEFLNGVDLRWHIERRLLSLPDKIDLMVQVAGALAFAHSKGIAHGNLKPSNIFVTEKDATVLDFGIGKCLASVGDAGDRTAVLQPNYFAPEQILGKPISARSDVFSAAVVLYELLAKHPFGSDPNVIAREIVHSTPEPLRSLDPQIPEDLDQLLVRALDKDPERRLGRADELAAGLYLISQRLRGVAKPAEPVAGAVLTTPVAEDPLPMPTAFASPVIAAPVPPAQNVVSAPKPADAPPQTLMAALSPNVPAPAQAKSQPADPVRTSTPQAPPRAKQTAANKASGKQIRWLPYAIAAVLTFCIALTFLSRQSIHASQGKAVEPAAAQTQPLPAPEPQTSAAPVAQPAPAAVELPTPAAAPVQSEPSSSTAGQSENLKAVKAFWASGKYAQALEKVNEILAADPENLEGRVWKKKIRAAQEAEAAMK